MALKASPCDWLGPACGVVKWPVSQLKSAATGTLKEEINAVAKDLWNFSSSVLKTVYGIMDMVSRPQITYSPDGPLGHVFPYMIWAGLLLTVILAFAQVGMSAITGPKSLVFLLKGAASWAIAWFSALLVLNAVNTGATVLAKGIITSTFKVDSWQGLSGDDSFMNSSIHGLEGIALAGMSVLVVIPYGFGLLAEMLIRQAGMEVLAATFPIIIAGLVNEKTARWFWTGVRWMMALICMLPLIAVSMSIGHSIAVASVHGSTLSVLGQGLVSGTTNMLTLLWPFALFKLFAFMDPNTVQGASFRSSLAGLGGDTSGGGGDDTEGAKNEQEGAGDSGAGAVSPAGGADGSPASGDGQQSSAGGPDASSAGSMFSGTLAALSSTMADVAGGNQAASGADHASSSMDAVGAGHTGGGTTGDPGEDEDHDNSRDSDSDDETGSNDPKSSTTGGDGTGNQDDPSGPGADGVPETPSQAMDANSDAIGNAGDTMPIPQGANPTEDGSGRPGSNGQGGPGDGGPGGGAGGGAAGGGEAAVVA